MDGIHKSILWVALGVFAGIVIRPILATTLNPMLTTLKIGF
jgi:hypothetical protein